MRRVRAEMATSQTEAAVTCSRWVAASGGSTQVDGGFVVARGGALWLATVYPGRSSDGAMG